MSFTALKVEPRAQVMGSDFGLSHVFSTQTMLMKMCRAEESTLNVLICIHTVYIINCLSKACVSLLFLQSRVL